MKVSAIQAGGIYHDGKQGVREVVSIDIMGRTAYRILAAKVEQKYSYLKGENVSLLGETSVCTSSSFAAWAKLAVPATELSGLLAILSCRKLRLPAGEAAFMKSVAESFGGESPIGAGAGVSFEPGEARAAKGVEKKGLATVSMGAPGACGEIVLTELGAAWCKAAIAK